MLLTPRARQLVKWIGYPVFGLFSFIVCLYLTFPYQRLKNTIEDHVAASGELRATIGDISPSPLLGVTLSDVRITILPKEPRAPLGAGLRATKPAGVEGEPAEPPKKPKPQTIVLEEVTVSTGLFALITGGIDVSFAVSGFGGEVEGEYRAAKKKGWSADIEVEEVDLRRVPQIAEAVGLPVRGKLSAEVTLAVPLNRWAKASGAISLSCTDCSVGDGKAKLKVPGNPLLAMGVTLPRIRLGRLGGEVQVEEGLATFRNLSAKSPDVEVELEGTVRLRQPLGFSRVDGYLKFKIDPELKRRDAKFELVENGLGKAKRSDGFFGMQLSGTLKNLRPRPSATNPLERRRRSERARGTGPGSG